MATTTDHPPRAGSSRCQLLSLPTELRREIYHHLLSPPFALTLHITRGYTPATLPNPSNQTPPAPTSRFKPVLKTSLSPPPTPPLATSLLYACKETYNEFLPLLYATLTFQPTAMFDAFLSRLSPFAAAHIRTVRLCMERLHHGSEDGVAWAVLCAQVKSLVGVKRVEVVYRWDGDSRNRMVRNLLRGLVGMRGVVFVGCEKDEEEEALVRMLGEVEREVVAGRKMRGEQMVATKDLRTELARDECGTQREETGVSSHHDTLLCRGEPPAYCSFSSTALQHAVANHLVAIEEPGRNEMESEEWDMVSDSRSESAPRDSSPRSCTDAKQSETGSDGELPLLPDCEDWEVVDPWRSEDNEDAQ